MWRSNTVLSIIALSLLISTTTAIAAPSALLIRQNKPDASKDGFDAANLIRDLIASEMANGAVHTVSTKYWGRDGANETCVELRSAADLAVLKRNLRSALGRRPTVELKVAPACVASRLTTQS